MSDLTVPQIQVFHTLLSEAIAKLNVALRQADDLALDQDIASWNRVQLSQSFEVILEVRDRLEAVKEKTRRVLEGEGEIRRLSAPPKPPQTP